MNSNLGTHLRALAALAMSLGAVSASQATTAGNSLNGADSMKRMERFAVSAEAKGAADATLSALLPWYYQAWPESTWRQHWYGNKQATTAGEVGSQARSLSDILDSVC